MKKDFYFGDNKQDKITLEWTGDYKQMNVFFNDKLILDFKDKYDLKSGKAVNIGNNQDLSIRLMKKKLTGQTFLELLINNVPVPGSDTDPWTIHKTTWIVIFFIAGLNILAGILFKLFQTNLGDGLGLGTISFGVIFLILGFLVKFKTSLIALYFSIVLIIIDLIFSFILFDNYNLIGIFIKLFFIQQLFEGVAGLKKIKKTTANTAYKP